MKLKLLHIVLLFGLIFTKAHAQNQQIHELLWSPNSWVYSMMFEDEHTFVANRTIVDQYSNVAEIQFVRMTDEGEELASQRLFSQEEYAEKVWMSPLQCLPDGGLALFTRQGLTVSPLSIGWI